MLTGVKLIVDLCVASSPAVRSFSALAYLSCLCEGHATESKFKTLASEFSKNFLTLLLSTSFLWLRLVAADELQGFL